MDSESVCKYVERQSRENPDRTAVIDSQRSLSYRELLSRSLAIKADLQAKGLVAVPVGVWAEKSVETVATIQGILAAGSACVPIDPQNPSERVMRIIEESEVRHVFADREAPVLRGVFQGKIVGEVAFILHTSGSSGRPKGVCIPHRSVRVFAEWGLDFFELSSDDRVASVASFQFDLSLFDLFATFAAGATLCLCPRELLSFPESFLVWLREQRITTLYTVPSLLVSLLEVKSNALEALPQLKRVLFAGEPMPPQHLAKLMKTWPHVRFYNLYGPTETNVCTVFSVSELPYGSEPLPIGRPCTYNDVEIRRENGELAGVGEQGELVVRGPNVMLGYWPPSAGAAGEVREYRTGDLGMKDADGVFHFRGRRDNMLKIRGYRMEPAEIEAALLEHPKVTAVAVVGKARLSDRTRLAAIVVLKSGEGISPSEKELRLFCAQRLPNYMIPELWEFRSSLPLNLNGKIDRAALAHEADHED